MVGLSFLCCLLCRFPEAESTVSFLHRMIRAEVERQLLLEQERKKRECQGSARDDEVWGWSKRQLTDSAREEIGRQVTAILAESVYDAEAMALSSLGSCQVTHMMSYPPMPDLPSHTRNDLSELSWSSSISKKSNSLRQRSTGQRSYGSQRSRVSTSASSHGFLELPLW